MIINVATVMQQTADSKQWHIDDNTNSAVVFCREVVLHSEVQNVLFNYLGLWKVSFVERSIVLCPYLRGSTVRGLLCGFHFGVIDYCSIPTVQVHRTILSTSYWEVIAGWLVAVSAGVRVVYIPRGMAYCPNKGHLSTPKGNLKSGKSPLHGGVWIW